MHANKRHCHDLKFLLIKFWKSVLSFFMGRIIKFWSIPMEYGFYIVDFGITILLSSILRGSQWTGAYQIDFRDLIVSTPSVANKQSEEARFSFIQGGYVEDLDLQENNEVEQDEVLALVNVTEKALQVRDDDTQSLTKTVAKSGAAYFASRSYHGLDINGTNSLPGKFLTGRSGKASGYKDEKTQR